MKRLINIFIVLVVSTSTVVGQIDRNTLTQLLNDRDDLIALGYEIPEGYESMLEFLVMANDKLNPEVVISQFTDADRRAFANQQLLARLECNNYYVPGYNNIQSSSFARDQYGYIYLVGNRFGQYSQVYDRSGRVILTTWRR